MVSTRAFDEDELAVLEDLGQRRTATHLMDIRQTSLRDYGGDRR